MPQNNKTCLIIAQSGRALAASARAGGWAAHVLDRFADLDTVSAALSCQTVSGDDDGFHAGELQEKLTPYLTTPLSGVIYGSGLEDHYEILEFLHRHWTLLGNEASVVKACKDPALFFSTLSKLGIPHPHTSVTIPRIAGGHENWLLKRTGASGGGHIRAMSADFSTAPHYYFQKKLTGRSLSVVFLADARNMTIVGINEIWAVAPEKNDFRYSGAVTGPDVPVPIARILEDIIRVLVRDIGLRGLCGMDVIMDENGQCYILEINPRPTATFELHQTQISLCKAHVLACQEKLPALPPPSPVLKAHEVWYADRDFILPDFAWPSWVSDRPRSGRSVRIGEPVCIVHAEAMCMDDIRTLLQNRFAAIMELLGLQQLAA